MDQENKKGLISEYQAFFVKSVGWLMGLEPTTTGITSQAHTEGFSFEINSLKNLLSNIKRCLMTE
jgi:hypothetical protein